MQIWGLSVCLYLTDVVYWQSVVYRSAVSCWFGDGWSCSGGHLVLIGSLLTIVGNQ